MATDAPASLEHVFGGVDAAGDGEVGVHVAEQDRDPAQPETELGGRAEREVRHHLESLDVEIGLVEPVEEHEAVRTRLVELQGHVRDRAEEVRQLHREGDADRDANVAHQIGVHPLDRSTARQRIGRDEVDVQLKRVATRLLDASRVVDPAAR
jgi:hypothetical protein